MDNNDIQKKRGRMVAVIFVIILILPLCYALLKELRYRNAPVKPAADSASVQAH